ncbi:MAG TPA: hypothetical protein VKW77_06085, partial [Acidimicrobiales bacterium]|nr:hypothetical protein [Acidimicrobiales bacterium]
IGSAVDAEDLAVATGGVAPFAVDGGREGCIGRMADALRLLGALAGATATPRPVREWIEFVADAFRSLLVAPSDLSWQIDALERALGEAREAAAGASGSPVPLEFAEFRRFLGEHLRPGAGRSDFFRGGVTVTSLVPLRWVPFRVVCLLGMDEASLARGHPAGDDLLQSPSMVGDPDQRSDLRQALLDAVLAAEDHLLVFRDGRSPRSNQPVPPAVAVAELREAVLSTVPGHHRDEVARRLEIEHPCHPFDERCFVVGGLVEGRRWGFGRGDLEGARARHRRQPKSRPFLDGPLEPPPGDVIDLADLYVFLDSPMAWFLSRRLEVRVPRGSDRTETGLPVHPGPLPRWKIGERLLRARLDGHTVEAWRRHEAALGTLPPGVLGKQLLADIEAQVDDLVGLAGTAGVTAGSQTAVPIDVRLPDGPRIAGEIPCSLGSGEPGTATVTFSRDKPTQRLRAWLDLMALSAARPDVAWRSVVVSRRDGAPGATGSEYVLTEPTGRNVPPTPLECLDFAAKLFRLGATEPLPIFPKVSYAFYDRPSSAASLWRDRGRTDNRAPCEGEDPLVELVLGRCSFEDLVALPARGGDPGPPGERSRARRLARALYGMVATSTRPRRLGRRREGHPG